MKENKRFLNWLFIVPIIIMIISVIIGVSFPTEHENTEEEPAIEESSTGH